MDGSLIPTMHPWPLRFLKSVRFALARIGRTQVQARAAPFDLVFTGPVNDCITRHIYRFGSHEPVITRYLLDNIRIGPGEIAIDVGANLGWYSVLLDRLSDAGSRIFAFEPDPSTYDLLTKNLLTNHASRVVAVNMALGDAPGTAQLNRYRDSNNGRHTLMAGGNSSGGKVQVRVDTLQRFWHDNLLGNARIALLKIDVEGYEYFVLRGARELLANCDCILLEYAPLSVRAAGLETDALMEPFRTGGFRARVFQNERLVPISFSELVNAQQTCDLLLTKNP